MWRPSRRQAALIVLLIGAVAFFGYSLRPPRAPGAKPRARVASAAKQGMTRALPPAAPADADWKRYAALAGRNIFSEQRVPPPKPIRVLSTPPFQTPPRPPAPPRADFSGWTYVGYVALDRQTLGILQNDTTNACNFLAVGDRFMGASVEHIDREAMRLRSGSSTTTLSRPRDFALTPLNAGQGGTPTPRPPQPPRAPQ